MLGTKMHEKYLMITLNDNDFYFELEYVAYYLKDIWEFTEEYPKDDHDLDFINPIIQNLLYNSYTLITGRKDVDFSYFKPTLEIVDYLNIIDDFNHEYVFVPLFDDGDIIVK